MYEKLTARLDESCTWLDTGERVTRIREHVFTVVPTSECTHTAGRTICVECADDWQVDYEFDDPFPFTRVRHRWTVRELIDAGALHAGDELTMNGTGVKAIVTSTGGLMLPDGRVFDNPSAAAHAVLDR
jgi:hypothetical protein